MRSYKDIKLAIIITIYNNSNYIDSIFNCLANQTLLFDEVIVVDHGSKYNCEKGVLEASNKYKLDIKFKRIIKNFGGPAWPRNLGVQNSTSDYVCFNDPDDISLINRCEEIKKEIYLTNCDVIIHSFTTYIEDLRNHNVIKLGRTFINKFDNNNVLERLYFDDSILTPVSSYVIRRESILKKSFREEEEIIGGEDKVLIIDLLLNKNTICHSNKVLLLYNYGIMAFLRVLHHILVVTPKMLLCKLVHLALIGLLVTDLLVMLRTLGFLVVLNTLRIILQFQQVH